MDRWAVIREGANDPNSRLSWLPYDVISWLQGEYNVHRAATLINMAIRSLIVRLRMDPDYDPYYHYQCGRVNRYDPVTDGQVTCGG